MLCFTSLTHGFQGRESSGQQNSVDERINELAACLVFSFTGRSVEARWGQLRFGSLCWFYQGVKFYQLCLHLPDVNWMLSVDCLQLILRSWPENFSCESSSLWWLSCFIFHWGISLSSLGSSYGVASPFSVNCGVNVQLWHCVCLSALGLRHDLQESMALWFDFDYDTNCFYPWCTVRYFDCGLYTP